MFSLRGGLGRGRRLLLFFALLLLLFGTIANVQGGEPKPTGQEEGQQQQQIVEPPKQKGQGRGKPQQGKGPASPAEEQKLRGRRQQGGGQQVVPSATLSGPVGFGKHVLMEDGNVHLAPGWETYGYSDCDVKEEKEQSGKMKIQVSRNESYKGCTVDLVTSNMVDEFEFMAVLEPEEGKKLDDCLTPKPNENSLPFNYGKTNKELADFVKGPIYNVNAEGCKKECIGQKGGCMDSTSLEIFWSKHNDDYAFHLIPIGEPSMSSKSTFDVNDWGAAMNVKILKNQAGNGGAYEIKKFQTETPIVKSADAPEPLCINRDKAVPPPRFWPIVNAKDKEGKQMRLLVFHLLPRLAAANRINPALTLPKCRLVIEFAKYSLLSTESAIGPTTTTTTTSTITKSTTTGSKSTTTGSKSTTTGSDTTPEGNTGSNGTTSSGEEAETGGMKSWMWILIIGGVLLLVAVASFLIWFFVCRKGKKDDDSGEEGEAGEGADEDAEEEEEEDADEEE